MTENKRFKNVEENLEWGTVQYFTYHDEKITDKELEKLVNHLLNQNDELKQQSDNKQKHIVTLENKIVRMRKAIHKLEWLSTHRNADLQRENEQLKQEIIHWKKILDNHQQMTAKTLREQYHWLKNEDKISNHDKTVALLELESISERLGIDLN